MALFTQTAHFIVPCEYCTLKAVRYPATVDLSTVEQELIELARDLANIDYSDELDSDSDSDTYSGDEDDFPHHGASTTTPPRTRHSAEIATNILKALF